MEIPDWPVSRYSSRQYGPRARVNKVAKQSCPPPRRKILGGVLGIDTRRLMKKKKKKGGGDFVECVYIWAKKQRVSTEGERPTSQPRSDLGTTQVGNLVAR